MSPKGSGTTRNSESRTEAMSYTKIMHHTETNGETIIKSETNTLNIAESGTTQNTKYHISAKSYTDTKGDTKTVSHTVSLTETENHTPSHYYWSGSLGIAGIIFIFVMCTLLYWGRKKTNKLTKKFGDIFWSFIRFVCYEKSFDIFVGAFGQLAFILLIVLAVFKVWRLETILHISLEHFILYYVIYSLLFLGLWATPVIKNVLNLDSLSQKHFNNELAKRITRLRQHYIIFGYGQLGKSIVNDFIGNYTDPQYIYSESRFNRKLKRKTNILSDKVKKGGKTVLLLERFYNEKYEDILFCNNLVIVDKDESSISNIFNHPTFGKIGVVILQELNWLPNDSEDYEKKVYIPAIVGNIKESSILSLSRLDKSKMVLSFVSDESSTSHLFDTIVEKQDERKAFISSPSTNLEYYLTPKSYDTNISFLHNFRTRGWTLGNIVSACILGKTKNDNNADDNVTYTDNIRILILGQGKQIHFLLEKIWFEVLWQQNSTLITVGDIYNWDALLNEIKENTKQIKLFTSELRNQDELDLLDMLSIANEETLTDATKVIIVEMFNHIIKDNFAFL